MPLLRGAMATVAVLTALSGANAFAQPSYAPPNTGDVPNPYKTILNWGHTPDDREWGASSGVYAGPDGNIWTYERCGANTCVGSAVDPVFELDRKTGAVLRHFGKGLFVMPHGLYVDKDGNVWVTDGGTNAGKGDQVYKFSPDGKVLMTLGKPGGDGAGLGGFDCPRHRAGGAERRYLRGQGHAPSLGNSRIMKFDKSGKFIKVIAKKRTGPAKSWSRIASAWIPRGACSWPTAPITASRFSTRMADLSPSGNNSAVPAVSL